MQTELGPDATGLGWIFQYVLEDSSGQHSLADLRSLQDWYLRFHLKSVPGVAEVAPLGGFGRQYQVNVDPNRLLAYGIPISTMVEAVRKGNTEAGGRLVEFGAVRRELLGRPSRGRMNNARSNSGQLPPALAVVVTSSGRASFGSPPSMIHLVHAQDALAAWVKVRFGQVLTELGMAKRQWSKPVKAQPR